MQRKHGQISIYLVLALIIGLSLVFFASDNSNFFALQEQYPPDIEPVKQYIESCLSAITKEGIFQITRQGRYYKPSRYGIQIFNETIPYYFIEERVIIPDSLTIEDELSLYIIDNYEGCIQRYQDKNLLIKRTGE